MELLKLLNDNPDKIFMLLFCIVLFFISKFLHKVFLDMQKENKDREEYILQQHKETQKKNEERENVYLEFINNTLKSIDYKLDKKADKEDVQEIKKDIKEIKKMLNKKGE